MVHFTQYCSCVLYIQTFRWHHRWCRITPFGNPGVNGYVLLSPAYRSLSRPSSPDSSQASAIDLYSLGHIIFSALFLKPHRSCVLPFNQAITPALASSVFFYQWCVWRYSRIIFRPSFVISKNIMLIELPSSAFRHVLRHNRERNNWLSCVYTYTLISFS